MILFTVLMQLAHADLAPIPDSGRVFLEHQLVVEDLETAPDYVLVVHAPPIDGEITTLRALSSDSVHSTTLASGRSPGYRGDQIWKPRARLVLRGVKKKC